MKFFGDAIETEILWKFCISSNLDMKFDYQGLSNLTGKQCNGLDCCSLIYIFGSLGIIFSSPRCVYSVAEGVQAHDVDGDWITSLCSEWASTRLFCVGSSTMSTVDRLFAPIKLNSLLTGDESHAESLANKIIQGTMKHIQVQSSMLHMFNFLSFST